MTTHNRTRDSSAPIEPVGWQPGLDWEVREDYAELYDVTWNGDKHVRTVRSRNWALLALKMFVAQWRYRHHGSKHRRGRS